MKTQSALKVGLSSVRRGMAWRARERHGTAWIGSVRFGVAR